MMKKRGEMIRHIYLTIRWYWVEHTGCPKKLDFEPTLTTTQHVKIHKRFFAVVQILILGYWLKIVWSQKLNISSNSFQWRHFKTCSNWNDALPSGCTIWSACWSCQSRWLYVVDGFAEFCQGFSFPKGKHYFSMANLSSETFSYTSVSWNWRNSRQNTVERKKLFLYVSKICWKNDEHCMISVKVGTCSCQNLTA